MWSDAIAVRIANFKTQRMQQFNAERLETGVERSGKAVSVAVPRPTITTTHQPTERTMNAIEELRALPRVSIQKTYVSGGNATCVADGFVQSSDAEAIVTRQQAEIDDLRRQMAEVTKERDEYKLRSGSNQSYGVDFGSACGRNYLSVCGFVVAVEGDTQRDSKLASRFGSPWNKEAIDYVVAAAKEKDGDLTQAREQLATAEAEAAKLRTAVEMAIELTIRYERPGSHEGYEFSNKTTTICRNALNTTAGRDMLAEMRRKDERIKELESRWKRSFKEEARQRSKCHAAKAALVKARERIAELEQLAEMTFNLTVKFSRPSCDSGYELSNRVTSACRKLLDKPGFLQGLSDSSVMEAIKEPKPEPVYWRFKSRLSASYKADGGKTYVFGDYSNEWSEYGYPVSVLDSSAFLERCNADGSPLVKPVEPAADEPLKVGDWVVHVNPPEGHRGFKYRVEAVSDVFIKLEGDGFGRGYCANAASEFRRVPAPLNDELQELRQQLAAQAELVKLAEELREWLQGVDPLEAAADVRIVVTHEEDGDKLLGILKKIRDAKGSA